MMYYLLPCIYHLIWWWLLNVVKYMVAYSTTQYLVFWSISRVTVSYISFTSTSSSLASFALVATFFTFFSIHIGSNGLILFYCAQLRFIFLCLLRFIFYRPPIMRRTVCGLLTFFLYWAYTSCTYWSYYPVTRVVWVEVEQLQSILLTRSNDFYRSIQCIKFGELGCIHCTMFTIY